MNKYSKVIKILIEQNIDKKTNDFKNIVDQLLTGIIIFQDDCVKYINDAGADIFEYPIHDIQQWSIDDFLGIIYKEDRKIFLKPFRKGQEEGSSKSNKYIYRILTGTGKIKWVESTSNSIQYQSKTAVQVIINNYTDNKETELRLSQLEEKSRKLKEDLEQKLSKSEMNYKNLIEHLGMLLMIIDRDEIFQVVNEKAAESMGGKPTDFIGKSLTDIFPKDVAEKYIKVHQGIFKSGKGITFEHTLNLPTGTRTLYTSEQPVEDINGNIKAVQIISLDITEPKITKQKLEETQEKLKILNRELEQKVEKRTQELLKSEEIYRLISENATDMIAVLNDKFVYEYINENVHLKLLGYSKKDLIGTTNLELIHPNDRKKTVIATSRILRKGEGSHQVRFKTKNGDYKWLEVTSKNFYDIKGNKKVLNISRDVTERKKVEIDRNRAHSELDQIFNKASPMYLTDLEGTITKVNKRFLTFFNLNINEFIGKNCCEIWCNPWCNTEECSLKKIKRGLGSAKYEIEKKLDNGSIIYFLATSYPHQNHEGKLIGIIRVITDITERRTAEINLKESEERLKAFNKNLEELVQKRTIELKESEENLKKINDAFFKFTDDPLFNFQILINTAGILLKADCAMFNILKKVNGKEILETVAIYKEPPGFTKESEAEGHICTDRISDNIDGVVILRNLDKSKYAKTDGNVLKYNLKQYVSFIVRFNKIPIATFCVIYMDNREMSENDINILKILSQSASIELTRLNSRNKLIESEEKYRTLFESSKDGIIFTSMKGKILDCNQAYLDMLGYTLEEIKEFTYQQLTPEKWHEMEAGIFNNRFLPRGYSGEFEKEYIRKDGTIFPISINVWLIKDDQGNNKGMWAIVRNISKRKKAEDLIKEENAKLKELNKIKNNLIVRSSYELKTPLTSIYNASEILLKNYTNQLEERAVELLKIIYKGGKRLKTLILNLTEISKIKSKKLELNVEFLNISKIIHECINELSYLASEREQFLNVLVDEIIYIYIDKYKIKQVISEIILNAIHNTPPNGIISINLQKYSDYINVIIKDTGVGFTEAEKTKVFKEFGKIERYGKGMDIITDGMGLGLYISKNIVELHGGKIWVESEGRNQGSIVVIKLPLIARQKI